MQEKTGLEQTKSAILNSKAVADMDPHTRHALTQKLHSIRVISDLYKVFPESRYND